MSDEKGRVEVSLETVQVQEISQTYELKEVSSRKSVRCDYIGLVSRLFGEIMTTSIPSCSALNFKASRKALGAARKWIYQSAFY